jgi:hypothetical protein
MQVKRKGWATLSISGSHHAARYDCGIQCWRLYSMMAPELRAAYQPGLYMTISGYSHQSFAHPTDSGGYGFGGTWAS